LKRLARAVELAGVFGGIAMGTISICGMVPNDWGLISWTISIISAVRVFSTRRRPAEVNPRSIILRVILGCIVIFCFVFLTTMSVAVAANPGPVRQDDKITAAIIAVVGTAAAAIAIRFT